MNSLVKPKRERDEKYLAWIRTQPCLASESGICPGVEAHHVPPKGGGKVGSKTDDRRTVPLCHDAHMEYHRIGRREFEQCYALDLESVIKRLNAQYAKLHPIPRRRTVKPRSIANEVKDLKAAKAEIQRLNRELDQLKNERKEVQI